MTKEEFIGKMQMAYIGDKNALNECTQEYLRLREVINKAIKYINESLIISSILDGKETYCLNNYTFDYKELLDILKEVE